MLVIKFETLHVIDFESKEHSSLESLLFGQALWSLVIVFCRIGMILLEPYPAEIPFLMGRFMQLQSQDFKQQSALNFNHSSHFYDLQSYFIFLIPKIRLSHSKFEWILENCPLGNFTFKASIEY